ncbi:hypothetical protein J9303_07500 [Bacillaceae bacterium Marseille-Q3522]|nr:hypothetical protein [Bacillaceae bacterium Marseille-Q3522]
MFKASGFFKTVGIVIIVLVFFSFIAGFFMNSNPILFLIMMYVCTYVLSGVLAPIWNQETPYFASFLTSITLTVINLFFSVYLLNVMVLADPVQVNSSLVRNSLVSLFVTFIVVQILKRKQVLAK